ncbi:sterol 3-beta-glucosyltransferase UGT80A2 isoform X2 [Camellia sinensis]|uniref:sterol 3-beta-glucosyltransferase UGT80A2 isoform X2 n=1 Tax=Camellia sinensis TaxID=4442 RepID=UPI0010363ECB|nr:sterol 3-beta-glucosyltransferase UGT80A2 isoform X2 [Camellia sinensis]
MRGFAVEIVEGIGVMETKSESTRRTQPVALFMAFGTKGDVYPISAIAAAFAFDQEQYRVVLVTHSAHKNLSSHLAAKNVEYLPVSSPPVLSPYEDDGPAGTVKLSFSLQKRRITKEHRLECISNVEQIFGGGPSLEGDFIVINFFALEGWNLAELFHVRCIVAAPYVVPYSAPSSFERYFREELPPLYEYLQEAPIDQVGWKDVIHWMWPLFTEDWGSWRSDELKLSPWPFTVYLSNCFFIGQDPVTGLPAWHDRYGFSKEVVECPGYWPSNVRVCGFWFLPLEWQFSCNKCAEISALISSEHLNTKDENVMCSAHAELQSFLKTPASLPPVFIGFCSVGSMGFLRNPQAFLEVLRTIVDITSHRFILFSAGFEPLDAAIQKIADDASSGSEQRQFSEDGISIFGGRLFCFSGSVPYKWLFPRCAAAVHHGGSGSTAAALHAGIPQVVCPFMLDQFYWAERMFWLGVSSEPLKTNHLLPDESDDTCVREAANMLTRALNYALSSKVKARSSEIAERLSLEDGVLEALKILKEEISCSNTTRH